MALKFRKLYIHSGGLNSFQQTQHLGASSWALNALPICTLGTLPFGPRALAMASQWQTCSHRWNNLPKQHTQHLPTPHKPLRWHCVSDLLANGWWCSQPFCALRRPGLPQHSVTLPGSPEQPVVLFSLSHWAGPSLPATKGPFTLPRFPNIYSSAESKGVKCCLEKVARP